MMNFRVAELAVAKPGATALVKSLFDLLGVVGKALLKILATKKHFQSYQTR